MIDFLMRHLRLISRVLLQWLLVSSWAGFLFLIIPGLFFQNTLVAFLTILLLGFLNAWMRPTLIALSIPPTLLIFGSLTLLLNAFLIFAANQFHLLTESIGAMQAGFFVLLISPMNVILSTIAAIDDDQTYYERLVDQILNLERHVERSDDPGVIFLEVDGLSEPALRHAIELGYMPTLNEWLNNGSHKLASWECDFSSQSSSSQAGILLGNNYDVPAFRWYEKDMQKWMVSKNPADCAILEERLSTGDGLLRNGGASRGNMFSGDAPNSMFTSSKILEFSKDSKKDFLSQLLGPNYFYRLLVQFARDVVSELLAARHQRRHNIRPRVHRGGAYPLLRASATSLAQELTLHILIGDMIAGIPFVYTTFIGYDEVAHHSGIDQPDTLVILTKLDTQFARLQEIARRAPRPYKFVILSDHGLSQGATFVQRYGATLEELVCNLASPDVELELIQNKEDVKSYWGDFLIDLLQDILPESIKFTTRLIKPFVEPRDAVFQEVPKPTRHSMSQPGEHSQISKVNATVLASGNMGLIYFMDWEERLSLEQMKEAFPSLIDGLAQHDGIGFLLVHSDEHGPVAIGTEGTHFLIDNRIIGSDPLAPFGKNAPRHLLDASGFPHTADIIVNSFYNPETEEIAAFEELLASHGGLGGNQSFPFVLFPSEWEAPQNPIIGALNLHKQLKQWLRESSNIPVIHKPHT